MGDHNLPHIHQGPWTRSGVVFVAGTSGDLVFEPGERRVRPEPGLVVVFPSSARHRVEPATERRITVGFNLT